METVKRMNRASLKAAKEKFGLEGSSDNDQMMNLVVSVIAAVAVYFLLNKYRPEFVMKTNQDNGAKEVDQMRLWGVSLLVAVVVYFLMERR